MAMLVITRGCIYIYIEYGSNHPKIVIYGDSHWDLTITHLMTHGDFRLFKQQQNWGLTLTILP
jgi:hypothetical protein